MLGCMPQSGLHGCVRRMLRVQPSGASRIKPSPKLWGRCNAPAQPQAVSWGLSCPASLHSPAGRGVSSERRYLASRLKGRVQPCHLMGLWAAGCLQCILACSDGRVQRCCVWVAQQGCPFAISILPKEGNSSAGFVLG